MSYEVLQTGELQRFNSMADEIAKNEMRVNVIESTSTDNLVFSGDEFNIRTDNRQSFHGFIDVIKFIPKIMVGVIHGRTKNKNANW
jgi:hypothetical protein